MATPTADVTSLPRLNPFQAKKQSLGHIIFGMQATNHPKWGFVIYRTTYADDALFGRYMAHLRERVAWALDIFQRTDSLGPLLQWTVVEDRPSLDGASKDRVRGLFQSWVAARSVERDGPGADAEDTVLLARVPRYRSCLVVDDECLASLDKTPRQVRAVVVNGEKDEVDVAGGDEEGDVDDLDEALDEVDLAGADEHERVGGSWMYLNVDQYVSLYQEHAWQSEWRSFYRHPPKVYEGH